MNINVDPKKQPEKPKSILTVKDGQRASILIPYEESARERVLELLKDKELTYETEEERREKNLPKIVFQVKLSKLGQDDVLFTAVPAVAKMGPRKQPVEYALKLSKPIVCKQYIASADDDGDVDPRAVVDAMQSALLPFTCRVGEDSVLKIFAS